MQTQLIQSEDEHHWVLLEHRVTQLVVELKCLRIQTWSMEGSIELRLAGAFTLRTAGGSGRALDAGAPESLAPALALVGQPLRSLTFTRDGQLVAQLGEALFLEAMPDARIVAWEVEGGGVLEGMSYRCPARGGVPWA